MGKVMSEKIERDGRMKSENKRRSNRTREEQQVMN
jgi:hypothetical protein